MSIHGSCPAVGKTEGCTKHPFVFQHWYAVTIPKPTAIGGYHRAIKPTKNGDITKMAEKYINCMSTLPTPPRVTKQFFRLKTEITKRLVIFGGQSEGGYFFDML